MTKKDPFKALHSPAVDKTRAVLRANSGDRVAHSGDERGPSRKTSTSSRSGLSGGFNREKKSVRLVMPDEAERSEP